MRLSDLLRSGENKRLKEHIEKLEAMLTPELSDLMEVRRKLEDETRRLNDSAKEAAGMEAELARLRRDIQAAKQELVETDEMALMQSFGLYTPKYPFSNSEQYKERLDRVRQVQKEMVKEKTAATGSPNWTVNNNAAKGKKMVADMQKLLIRAFNSECDEVIGKVKFNNIEAGIKRIQASRNAISKLGEIMGVSITSAYYNAKIDELYLAYEYQVKKQEEKEEQRRLREELREQAKLEKELEEARKKIQKDQRHYEIALSQTKERLALETDETQKAQLSQKLAELEAQLGKLAKDMEAVDYREAHQKAGYVYVISNIGAFGENAYKIGMTRRLEPMDRIYELGDASVPFQFDVHAMIFSEDAPKLESALHQAFSSKKLNMVNQRREFFRVSLDEIKRVVKENYDKTVDFVDIPDAEQYRQSILIRNTI